MKVLGYSLNITEALLNELESLFPDKLPIEQVTSEELAYLRGQQSVVQKLRDLQLDDKDF